MLLWLTGRQVATVELYCRDCTAGMPCAVAFVLVKQEIVGVAAAGTSNTCRGSAQKVQHSKGELCTMCIVWPSLGPCPVLCCSNENIASMLYCLQQDCCCGGFTSKLAK